MDPPINHLERNCALIQYLREASADSGGVKAAFAAAMLADLGYFESGQAHSVEESLRALLDFLVKGRYESTLAEISGHCKGCALAAECSIGQVVLKP